MIFVVFTIVQIFFDFSSAKVFTQISDDRSVKPKVLNKLEVDNLITRISDFN